MGLLSRAARTTASEPALSDAEQDSSLDEMGKALRERIKRLPEKKSTPYTALSLLKAYGAFQAGICLSLKDGNYSSYASVGAGIEKLSIPLDLIWSGEKAREKYLKPGDHKTLEIKSANKDLVYWIFPLDSGNLSAAKPWEAVMLLGVPESSDFDPGPLSAILEDVSDKLLLSSNRKAPEPQSGEAVPELSPADSGKSSFLEDEVALYHRMYLDFNCILLENPNDSGEKDDFCKKVSDIIQKTGTVVPLPSGRPLILLPIVMDRDLIAHRLSRALSTQPLLSFEANNPENVFTRIDSLL